MIYWGKKKMKNTDDSLMEYIEILKNLELFEFNETEYNNKIEKFFRKRTGQKRIEKFTSLLIKVKFFQLMAYSKKKILFARFS